MAKRYQKGDRLKASEVNRIIERETKPLRVTASGSASAVTTADAVHIVGATQGGRASAGEKTVVIVQKPIEADYYLRVRQVAHILYPPVPCVQSGETTTCSISYVGDELLVLPEYGLTVMDYDGLEQDVTKNPDDATAFFRARREENFWILSAPANGGADVKSVRLVTNPTPTTKTLTVVELYENKDGLTVDRVRIVEDEENQVSYEEPATFTARTLHNYVGRHYQRFYNRTPAMALPCIFFDGDWRVIPLDRFIGKVPSPTYQAGRCSTG